MKVTQQYVHLVEMVANARVLAAVADSRDLVESAENVKQLGTDMAEMLGVTKTNFDTDTIGRYMQLIGVNVSPKDRYIESLEECLMLQAGATEKDLKELRDEASK
jgi:hypothetical protein